MYNQRRPTGPVLGPPENQIAAILFFLGVTVGGVKRQIWLGSGSKSDQWVHISKIDFQQEPQQQLQQQPCRALVDLQHVTGNKNGSIGKLIIDLLRIINCVCLILKMIHS